MIEQDRLILGEKSVIARPLTKAGGNFQIPGLISTDLGYLNFLDICGDLYPREMPVDVKDNGFCGPSGVHAGFGSIRTVPGVGMNPVTHLPIDNALKRASMGLTNDWHRPRDRLIYRNLFRLALREWHVIDLKQNKMSKSGLPWLEFDLGKKLEMIRRILCNDARFNRVLDMTLRKQLVRLFKDMQYVIGYVHNVRWQVDDIAKERLVADLEYAISGGKRGRLFPADKAIRLHGKEWERFSACRLRLVQGLSLLPAAMEQIKFAGHMKHMFVRYGQTWHQTDVQSILDNLPKGYSIHAGDVSDYDSTAPWMMFEEFLDVMGEFYSPEQVEHTRASLQAPYVTPPVSRNDDGKGNSGIEWVGNMTNPADFVFKAGIRSGHPSVSCLGKLFKSGETLCLFDRMNGDVLGHEEAYLWHERDLMMINHGDDEWDLVPTSRDDEYNRYRYDKEQRYQYFKVEPEPGKGLIGKIVIEESDGRKKAAPRLQSRFQKSWQNESSVGSIKRRKYPIGYYARKIIYSECPLHKVAESIELYAWKKSGLEKRFGSVDYIMEQELRAIVLEANPESSADFEFLMDPDRIHYSLDESDITPAIFESVYTKVHHDEWIGSFKATYGGNIYG